MNTSSTLYTRSPHSGQAVSAGTRRDLRYLFTEHLLLHQRYHKELMMEYQAEGRDSPVEVSAQYEAITEELERRAALYRRCNDRSWPDAKGP